MDRTRLKRSFWATAKSLSWDERKLVGEALRQLDNDWPDLPHEGDDDAIIPPVLRCWVRAIPGTGLALYYTSDEAGVAVLAVVSVQHRPG